MMVRLLLVVGLVANTLILVVCTAESAAASSTSSATATSQSSSVKVISEATSQATSQASSKPKCYRGMKCPKNEEFSYCIESIQRAQYCTEKEKPCKSKSDTTSCKKGCICKKNYLRADNGTCIRAEYCPITCGANEVLDDCPADCKSDYCPTEEATKGGLCLKPDICPPPKCKCTFNHRRAINGSCILTKSCPPFNCSARPNEEYNPCPPLCPTDDCSQASPTGECPPFIGHIGIILPCNPKCRCIKDYWRLDGICVPYGQCPGVCPDNERYSECIQAECRALNCSQKDQPVPCVRLDPRFCIKGCVCKEGYLRNQDGICVLEDNCETQSCPINEEFVPCIQGVCRAMNCSQRGQDVPCPDIPTEICDSGCICKEHYLRAENGSCVPEDQCDSLTCGENEVLDDCPMKCNSDYCPKSELKEQVCVQADPCVPACKCRFNYKRDVNGTCIPTTSCPPFDCSARPNEEYVACPPLCPTDDCGQPRLKGQCPFKIGIVLKCEPKCQCKDGYGRVNGTCVPFEECPDLCLVNEVYSPCVQQTCRPQNCSDRDVSMENCPSCDAASCQRGCVCQENYYRNDKGDCVSYAECDDESGPMCPYANEVYTSNFKECPPNICESLVAKYACDENQKEGPGCLCASGYLRLNLKSPCIPICECPQMKYSPDC